jgi:hypothetical protein
MQKTNSHQKTFLLKELQEKYAIFLSKYETIKNDFIKREKKELRALILK